MDELEVQGSAQRRDQYLTVLLGQQEFGIAILDVQEIRGWTTPTPVPNAPDRFRGVINLRGSVVPILDLRHLFGLPAPADDHLSVTVIVRVGDRVIGVAVDGVSDVLDIPPSDIAPPPDIGHGYDSGGIWGIARLNDRLVTLLVMEHLIGSAGVESAA